MKKKWLAVVLFATMLTLVGCNKQETTKQKTGLTIYTTVYPLADFAKKIGGEYVTVKSIYPPGVEAHTFEPTTQTMKELANADAFIYVGAGMEGFVDQTIEALKNERVTFIESTKGISLLEATEEHEEEEHHGHGDKDPHVWLDPIFSIQMAENIKNALIELKPEAKDSFEKNFASLKQQLQQLDEKFRTVVNSATKKELLVSHAAYGYWEKRYGIEQISIAGLSPSNEPSQKELAQLITTAKEHHIRYVIFEQNVTPKVADIVKNELKAEPLRFHNLETLTKDDMKENKDYFTIMNENINTLKKALQ